MMKSFMGQKVGNHCSITLQHHATANFKNHVEITIVRASFTLKLWSKCLYNKMVKLFTQP